MSDSDERSGNADAVAGNKEILRRVLDTRPSGTRLRLARTLGKNRSFISQISSPSYATPLPAQYIVRIFELCHFSPQDRDEFLRAYNRAHPNRRERSLRLAVSRRVTLRVPDLGDPGRNRAFDTSLQEFAARMAQLITRDGND